MKRSDLWQSRFLKCADLQGRPTDVVIDRAKPETLKNGKGEERKLVLYFRGKKKSLVVNMTNFDSIVDVTGIDDSDLWGGQALQLYPTTTTMGGTLVDCIRIRKPGQPALHTPQPAEPSEDELDDAIPFN